MSSENADSSTPEYVTSLDSFFESFRATFEPIIKNSEHFKNIIKLEEEVLLLKSIVTESLQENQEVLNDEEAEAEALKKHRDQLKAEMDRIRKQNEALHEGCEGLQKKAQHAETNREECRKLEEELEILRNQNVKLQEKFDRLKSKSLQENEKERYVQLKSERDCLCGENTRLQEKIYKMLKGLALGSCWEKKSEALEATKAALESQNTQLKEFHWNLTRAYDKNMAKYYQYKDKVKWTHELKELNEFRQQEIDKVKQKITILKATLKSYKLIDKEEAHIEAINKGLEKKKLKLEKELQTLEKFEVENGEITPRLSELRKENLRLYTQIGELKDQTAKTKQLKVQLKAQKAEKKALMRTQDDLKKDILDLETGGQKKLVDWLVAESKKYKDEIEDLRDENNTWQSQYEEVFVVLHSEELLKFSNKNAKQEIEATEKLNLKQRRDVRQNRIKIRDKAAELNPCAHSEGRLYLSRE